MHWKASLPLSLSQCVLLSFHGHRAFETVASSLSACFLPCRHSSMSQSVYVVSFLPVAFGWWGDGSVGAEKSALGAAHYNYLFTNREEDSKTIYEAITFCNPALMVNSRASTAAATQRHTHSPSERYCDHEQSVQRKALKCCFWFKMLQVACPSQSWTGTRGHKISICWTLVTARQHYTAVS